MHHAPTKHYRFATEQPLLIKISSGTIGVLSLKTYLVLLWALFAPVMSLAAQSTVVGNCQRLMNVAQPVAAGPDAPSIRIIEPADQGVVYGNQLAVTVETENFEFEPGGQHWHIWVDGQLMQMVYGPTAVINVAPGTHEICAIMSTAAHGDVGAPAGVQVIVVQPAAGTPTTTPAVAPEVAAVYSETELAESPLGLILIIGLGLLAAAGGWWIGTRLSGSRR